jgi:small conductance mechanosensitive channel
LERRANKYLPIVSVALRALLWGVALLAVLSAWGVDAFGWLATPAGGRLLNRIVSITIVLAAAAFVWEFASSGIETYLARHTESGKAGARARTLLPLLRNALLVVLSVMVSLIVLSEIGVDIGPLLAGAGVVGLAIGFGSQTLVKDVITGAFLLFEDAISVGDVVSVAGTSGSVEGLSIRSIRLRDVGGNVHTIPFSAVGAVTNMTKEFSFYVMDIGVAYREDTDHVTEVIREIAEEMRSEPEWSPLILEPLEVLGVDRFADSAVIIKARLKTLPVKQWMVGREFNRRMKKRFDALGIEIPFPHQTIYFGIDKEGAAPPARIRIDGPLAFEPRRAEDDAPPARASTSLRPPSGQRQSVLADPDEAGRK